MHIDLILDKLLTPDPTPEEAQRLADMAYMEWLGRLPGKANFHVEAMGAYASAVAISGMAPAAAVFCDRLIEVTTNGPVAIDLVLPGKERRGGAQARRALY